MRTFHNFLVGTDKCVTTGRTIFKFFLLFIVSGSISVVKTCKSNKASIVILPYKIAILKNAKAGYRDPENTEIQKMVKIILLILRNYQ